MSGKESVVAPQPIENIKNGFFPFYDKQPGIDIPAYAPEFASLEPSLQRLFVQTFVEGYQNPGKRVHADEWLAALKPLIDDIQKYNYTLRKGTLLFFLVQQDVHIVILRRRYGVLLVALMIDHLYRHRSRTIRR